MKSINTTRGEVWASLIKLANKLREAGDEKGAKIIHNAAMAIGRL